MAFTRILGPGIHTASNINSHNINSTGIITAVSFVGDGAGLTGIASTDNIITGTAATFNTYPVDINAGMTVAGVSSFAGAISGGSADFSGNLTVGGILTYEDVKNVDSIGIITARNGIHVGSGVSAIGVGTFRGLDINSHTELDNVNISGLLTATNAINIKSDDSSSGRVRFYCEFNNVHYVTLRSPAHADFSGYPVVTLPNETGILALNEGSKTIKVGTGVTIEPNGQATFTGIVTFGSGSTTIDNNVVNVGTALTLGHTQGLQFHTQNLHSQGFEVNQINATGVITATSFSGSGANLTGLASREVYGFTGIGNSLSLTTTNNGADDITNATYAAFEENFIGPSGISFSINTSGNLIMTV